MRNWIKYLIVTVIVAFITNGGQFYLWNGHIDTIKVNYENEIKVLSSTIENMGPLVDVYSIRTESAPGKKVHQEELKIVQSPASLINDSYIQEPSEIKDKYYKISIKPGTPLTADLLMTEPLDDSIREVDLVADTWTIGLEDGDYVDYEITYPFGEKYIVLSHIRVEAVNDKTIKAHLNSVERHLYNGALVDYFIQRKNGATVNLVKYPQPGIQQPAEVSYSIPDNIAAVITEDPNVINKINTALNAKKREIIESGLDISEFDSTASAIASGRKEVSSDINGASSKYLRAIEDELKKTEEEVNETPLQIEEGVVE